jgi:hypothetical protein
LTSIKNRLRGDQIHAVIETLAILGERVLQPDVRIGDVDRVADAAGNLTCSGVAPLPDTERIAELLLRECAGEPPDVISVVGRRKDVAAKAYVNPAR